MYFKRAHCTKEITQNDFQNECSHNIEYCHSVQLHFPLMAVAFIESIRTIEDENGARYCVFKILYRRKQNPLKWMVIDGIEIASTAALVNYTWKTDFHLAWPLVISALGAVSLVDFCDNAENYIRNLRPIEQERLWLRFHTVLGTIVFGKSTHGLSEAIRNKSYAWIPYFAFTLVGLGVAVTTVDGVEMTISDRSLFRKCCELLFGPTLIGLSTCYLLIVRQHEEWVRCLPMIAFAFAADQIAVTGGQRVENNNEPRWLLFKGLELLVGGSLLVISGCISFIYAIDNKFRPLFIGFFSFVILNGILDIGRSITCFNEYSAMEAPVFRSICGMIGGPVLFISSCVVIKYAPQPLMLPIFLMAAGSGLTILGKSVIDLYYQVPPPIFNRHCQRVLGPVLTVYGSLAAGYAGYHMGRWFSLAMMPLIPVGIYLTYRGFRRRNE